MKPLSELSEYGKASRRWRFDKDMSIRKLAEILGTSYGHLACIEVGRHRVTDAFILRLPDGLRQQWAAIRIKEYKAKIAALSEGEKG